MIDYSDIMNDASVDTILQNILEGSESLKSAVPKKIAPLAGDASQRSYYRVQIGRGAGKRDLSAILLIYGDAKGPQFKTSTVTQEEALNELSLFFRDRGIPVPSLYQYSSTDRAFLFEDFGETAFADLIAGKETEIAERIKESLGAEWNLRLFEQGIAIIGKLQTLPYVKGCAAFERALAFQNYRNEANEFIEYFGPSRGLKPSEADLLSGLFDALCETIMAIPKRLSHFDFHAFNLMARPSGELGIIDYQDACQVSWVRDLVSFLNDRGMDERLGAATQKKLIQHFTSVVPQVGNLAHDYNMTLLHWDIRVSGRFEKLGITKKTDRYKQWLPGTQRRLGRTLMRSYKTIHGFEDMLEIVARISPEAREGMDDPWDIF